MPSIMPVRSTSTSTLRLPFHQSSASRPLWPGLSLEAFSVSSSWTLIPRDFGLVVIRRGHAVLGEPREVIAHAALARLETEETGQDAVLDVAAHALDDLRGLAEHHVAGAGAHDRDHDPLFGDRGGGDGDVRVDVCDRDRDSRHEAHLRGHFGRSARRPWRRWERYRGSSSRPRRARSAGRGP